MAQELLQAVKQRLEVQTRLASDEKSKLAEIRLKRATNAIDLLTDHAAIEKAIKDNDIPELIAQIDKQLGATFDSKIKEIIAQSFQQYIQHQQKIPSAPTSPPRKIRRVELKLKEKTKAQQPTEKKILIGPKRPPPKPLSSTKPEFNQRLHPKINLSTDIVITSSGREASLVTPNEYKALQLLQRTQLEKRDSKKRVVNQFFRSVPDPSNPAATIKLRYPVFIGANGQMIAIMEAQKLGQGSFGTVFIGMDLESGKLVAIKEQNPKKKVEEQTQDQIITPEEKERRIQAYQKEIREEIKKLSDLNRLVSSIEVGDKIYAVDELAFGKDYEKEVIALQGKTSDQANLKRMDMALQFLEQIDSTHKRDGILHRDIKVGNMQWDDANKKAKVFDFGFSTPIPKSGTFVDTRVVGTPIYIAPEILSKEHYSVQSDIYACGVALIEIFSQNDIFNHVDEWNKIFNSYSSGSDPQVFINFFKKAAPDLFTGKQAEDLKPIVDLIHKMVDPNAKNRPALADVMKVIQQQKYKLEERLFLETQVNKEFTLTSTHVENPYIKKILYNKLTTKDETFLNKIKPQSFFILLLQAAKDNHSKIFELLAERFGLFETKNTAYTTSILKAIVENAANGKNYDLIYTYLNQGEKAGKIEEARRSLESLLKTYNIKLDKDVNFVTTSGYSSSDEAKLAKATHEQVIAKKEAALTRVRPLVTLTDAKKVHDNKVYNDQMLRTLDIVTELFKSHFQRYDDLAGKAEFSIMVRDLLRVTTTIEDTSQYVHNERKIDFKQVIAQWNKLNPDKKIESKQEEKLLKVLNLNQLDAYFDILIADANAKWGNVHANSEFASIIKKLEAQTIEKKDPKTGEVEIELKYQHFIRSTDNLKMGDFIQRNFPHLGFRNQLIIDAVMEYSRLPQAKLNDDIISLIRDVETINTIRVQRDKILEAQRDYDKNPEYFGDFLQGAIEPLTDLIDTFKEQIKDKNEPLVQHLENLKQELLKGQPEELLNKNQDKSRIPKHQ